MLCGKRDELARADGLSRGVVRVAAPDQVGAPDLLAHVRAGELARLLVDDVRRVRDGRPPARRKKRARAEVDDLVGTGSDHDLAPVQTADVARRRLAQRAVLAVRVLVQVREALRERDLRDAGERRRVLVEADDLLDS